MKNKEISFNIILFIFLLFDLISTSRINLNSNLIPQNSRIKESNSNQKGSELAKLPDQPEQPISKALPKNENNNNRQQTVVIQNIFPSNPTSTNSPRANPKEYSIENTNTETIESEGECPKGHYLLNNRCYYSCPSGFLANNRNLTCSPPEESPIYSQAYSKSQCLNACGAEYLDCSCKADCKVQGHCCSDYQICEMLSLYAPTAGPTTSFSSSPLISYSTTPFAGAASPSNNLEVLQRRSGCAAFNTDLTLCLQCAADFYFHANYCVALCPSGFHASRFNRLCIQDSTCSAYCENCNPLTQHCETCEIGFFLWDGNCVEKCPKTMVADRVSMRCEAKPVEKQGNSGLIKAFFWLAPSGKSCVNMCGVRYLFQKTRCSCEFDCQREGSCCEDFVLECLEEEKFKEKCRACELCEVAGCKKCKPNAKLRIDVGGREGSGKDGKVLGGNLLFGNYTLGGLKGDGSVDWVGSTAVGTNSKFKCECESGFEYDEVRDSCVKTKSGMNTVNSQGFNVISFGAGSGGLHSNVKHNDGYEVKKSLGEMNLMHGKNQTNHFFHSMDFSHEKNIKENIIGSLANIFNLGKFGNETLILPKNLIIKGNTNVRTYKHNKNMKIIQSNTDNRNSYNNKTSNLTKISSDNFININETVHKPLKLEESSKEDNKKYKKNDGKIGLLKGLNELLNIDSDSDSGSESDKEEPNDTGAKLTGMLVGNIFSSAKFPNKIKDKTK